MPPQDPAKLKKVHIATEVIKFAIQTEGESLSKLLNTIYKVAPHLRRSN